MPDELRIEGPSPKGTRMYAGPELAEWCRGWADGLQMSGPDWIWWCCRRFRGPLDSPRVHSEGCPLWGDGGLFDILGVRRQLSEELGGVATSPYIGTR